MGLKKLRDALLSITPNVYHSKLREPPYIVWAEEGQAGASYGDGKMSRQVLTGTIDYYTKDEYDAGVWLIQNALNTVDIGWRLNSIQLEDEIGVVHYEWVWTMAVNPFG